MPFKNRKSNVDYGSKSEYLKVTRMGAHAINRRYTVQEALNPKNVAVVGASSNPTKVGNSVLKSLTSNPDLKVYPVNPKLREVEGLKVYPSLSAIPSRVDLTVIAVPRDKVISAVKESVSKRTKGIVIISSGFREADDQAGPLLQSELTKICTKTGVRIFGPNIFGFVNVVSNVNASFTPMFSSLKKGHVAVVSQSGGICHYLMHNYIDDLGFSYIIHVGNRCDVDFPEVLSFLKDDVHTQVITLYVEGVDDARELYQAISETAKAKPVIALKAGKSAIADKASKSHTGSLSGNYQLYRCAMKQAGAVVVDSPVELLDLAKALTMFRKVKSGGVAILAIQAGLGFMALDIIEESGGVIAKFKPETLEFLHELLPPITMRDNPIDIAFSGLNIDVMESVLETIAKDESVGLILFAYAAAPPTWTIPPEAISGIFGRIEKPVMVVYSSTMEDFRKFKAEMEHLGVPTYSSLERAAKIAAIISKHSRQLSAYKLG
ncbi:MAG: CoA-binding protein [Candidatus Bathyarchaeia archaeon]